MPSLSESQNPACAVEHNCADDPADDKVGNGGAGPCDQGTRDDHSEVGQHVVGGEDVACSHVRAAITMPRNEHKARDVCDKRNNSDSHHQSRDGLAAEDEPASDLEQSPQRKHQLQPPCDVGRLHLQVSRTPTFFVNGKRMPGAIEIDELEKTIKPLLGA